MKWQNNFNFLFLGTQNLFSTLDVEQGIHMEYVNKILQV